MTTWLPTAEAVKALGCSRSSLKNWRRIMPDTLWQDSGGARLYDVEGVRTWRTGRPRQGRPRDVPKLTQPAAPSAEVSRSPAKATGPPATSDGTELEELDPKLRKALLELLAGGGEPAQILELSRRLPADTINRLSALGKTRKDLADAEKKELENQRARGELVALVDVEAFWASQVSIVHAAFMSLPGRVANDVHALETAEEVYELLERELRRVLEQFSRELAV